MERTITEPVFLGGACFVLCMLERLLMGSLTTTPILGLAVVIYLLRRIHVASLLHHERVWWAAEARAAQQYAKHLPAIRENAVCLSSLFASLWPHFIAAKFKSRLLALLQTAITEKVPEKYAMEVREIRLGSGTPVVKEMSLCTDVNENMEAMDVSIFYESGDMMISLAGRTPVGTAIVKVTSIRLSGVIRLIPVPTENLLIWAFVSPPALDIGLSAAVGGVSIGQFNFLKRVIADVVKQQVTEPRRKAVALYVEDAPRGVRFMSCSVQVGVGPVFGDVLLGEHDQVVLHAQIRAVQLSSPPIEVLPGAAAALASALDTDPLHMFSMRLEEPTAALIFKVSSCAGQELAQAVVNLKYLRDGCVAMWAIAADGGVIAHRWRPNTDPVQFDLPLELFQWSAGASSASKYSSRLSASQGSSLLREPLGAKPVPTFRVPHRSKRKMLKEKLRMLKSSIKTSMQSSSPASTSHSRLIAADSATLTHRRTLSLDAADASVSVNAVAPPTQHSASVSFSDVAHDEAASEKDKDNAWSPTKATQSPKQSELRCRSRFPLTSTAGGDGGGRVDDRAATPGTLMPAGADDAENDSLSGEAYDEAAELTPFSRVGGTPPAPSHGLMGAGAISADLLAFMRSGSSLAGLSVKSMQRGGVGMSAALSSSASNSFASTNWQGSKSVRLGLKRTRSMLPSHPAHQACVRVSIQCTDFSVFRPNLGAIPDRSEGDRAIVVNIVSAEILTADSSGTRDCFVKIYYGNRRMQTNVQYQTCDPVWHDTWVLPENAYVVGNLVNFEVYDKNTRGSVLLGRCKLSMNGLEEMKVHSHTLPLTGSNTGTLSLEVAVCPGDVDSDAVKRVLAHLSKNVLQPDMFKVVVERARDLIPTDFHFRGSSADPYIKLVHGSQSFSTPILYKCLNPEWNSHFQFRLEAGQMLKLTCYDRDKLKADEFMGSIGIDLESMQHDFQGWVKLSGVKRGEVYLRIFQSRSSSTPTSPASPMAHVTIVRRNDPEQPVMTAKGPLSDSNTQVNLLAPEPGSPGLAPPISSPPEESVLEEALHELDDALTTETEGGAGQGLRPLSAPLPGPFLAGGGLGVSRLTQQRISELSLETTSLPSTHPWLRSNTIRSRTRGQPSRLEALFRRRRRGDRESVGMVLSARQKKRSWHVALWKRGRPSKLDDDD